MCVDGPEGASAGGGGWTLGTTVRINADLCCVGPSLHRCLYSIRGLRKNGSYQNLRDSRKRVRPPPVDPPGSLIREYGAGPDEERSLKIRWSADLLDGVARWEAVPSLAGCVDLNVQLSLYAPIELP